MTTEVTPWENEVHALANQDNPKNEYFVGDNNTAIFIDYQILANTLILKLK